MNFFQNIGTTFCVDFSQPKHHLIAALTLLTMHFFDKSSNSYILKQSSIERLKITPGDQQWETCL